jgi:hypothetical protein
MHTQMTDHNSQQSALNGTPCDSHTSTSQFQKMTLAASDFVTVFEITKAVMEFSEPDVSDAPITIQSRLTRKKEFEFTKNSKSVFISMNSKG